MSSKKTSTNFRRNGLNTSSSGLETWLAHLLARKT
uniref:Uncharacterized protein n=1 Tax=Arundo donax TaxID=35708 RepID=A0A0A9GZI8_ARUDO